MASGIHLMKIQVLGYEPATGDTFDQEFTVVAASTAGNIDSIKRSTAGTASNTGSLAAAATVTVVSNQLKVQVTGEAAKTINWYVNTNSHTMV